ncbi:hypothetical protein QR680_014100 [Steinernema hermaphroditum]|uniref:PDZ domain-containing protein n=1 Tax=Steinernema hermaphroditum TaxID=289476 RepID=A0AA39IAA6_9BILA|nr:hypothetical protein QR680_014100 [Steinernema hermaphroditum]
MATFPQTLINTCLIKIALNPECHRYCIPPALKKRLDALRAFFKACAGIVDVNKILFHSDGSIDVEQSLISNASVKLLVYVIEQDLDIDRKAMFDRLSVEEKLEFRELAKKDREGLLRICWNLLVGYRYSFSSRTFLDTMQLCSALDASQTFLSVLDKSSAKMARLPKETSYVYRLGRSLRPIQTVLRATVLRQSLGLLKSSDDRSDAMTEDAKSATADIAKSDCSVSTSLQGGDPADPPPAQDSVYGRPEGARSHLTRPTPEETAALEARMKTFKQCQAGFSYHLCTIVWRKGAKLGLMIRPTPDDKIIVTRVAPGSLAYDKLLSGDRIIELQGKPCVNRDETKEDIKQFFSKLRKCSFFIERPESAEAKLWAEIAVNRPGGRSTKDNTGAPAKANKAEMKDAVRRQVQMARHQHALNH